MTKISKTTKTSGNKLVFFGNERLATGVSTDAPTLRALLENGYDVVAVVANYELATSRVDRELEIVSVAHAYHIPIFLPKKLKDIATELASYQAEIGVLVAYGKMVPQEVIDIFPKGIINIHPSLLPLHRGPTPLESVILNGDSKTGVSIMSLVKEMDAGPVYAQSELKLRGTETKQELAATLIEIGSSMIIEILPGVLDGSIVALPQDNSRATYDDLIKKEDGIIDWSKPAIQLEREVRAFAEWPKSRTELAGKDVTITKAHVVKESDLTGKVQIVGKQLIVACGEDSLSIDELKPAGKKEMPVTAFLAGYGKNL